MTHIVDANGPHSSRPGLMKVLDEVNAHEAEIEANGHTNGNAMVATASTQNFAPPTDPERMRQIAARTDEFVRGAYKEAGKALMAMADEAQKELDAAKVDIVAFVTALDDISAFHSDRLQGVFDHVQGILARVAEERRHSAALLAAQPQANSETSEAA